MNCDDKLKRIIEKILTYINYKFFLYNNVSCDTI